MESNFRTFVMCPCNGCGNRDLCKYKDDMAKLLAALWEKKECLNGQLAINKNVFDMVGLHCNRFSYTGLAPQRVIDDYNLGNHIIPDAKVAPAWISQEIPRRSVRDKNE